MTKPLDPYDPDRRAAAEELAWSDAPAREQLASWAEHGDWMALADFAEALGQRRDHLWVRGPDVATQEQAFVPGTLNAAGEAVDVAAVAAVIRSSIVETGDDVATVATSLGIEPDWARGVLTGEVAEVDPIAVNRMCLARHSTPHDLFGATGPGATTMPATLDWGSSPGSRRQLVDAAGYLSAEEPRRQVAALGGPERLELAEALDQRHLQLGRWAEGLEGRGERLARVVAPEGAPHREPEDVVGPCLLPAAPAAEQIVMLMVDTGDDLDTVSRGLGMRPSWVQGVVDGDIDPLEAGEASRLCAGLGLSPSQVFGTAGDVSEAPVAFDPFVHDPSQRAHALDLPDVPDLDFGP